MRNKLLIVMANSDPSNPEEFGPPLFQATVAAAMSRDVELVLTGLSGFVAIRGNAEKIVINSSTHRTVYDLIKEAHAAGVVFKVCTPTLEMWGENLIDEIDETVGAAYVINEAMEDDTVTFTY
jgi:uncharacterized protein